MTSWPSSFSEPSRHPLIVVGGGEFGRVVIDAALAADWDVIGFVDPLPCEKTTAVLGTPRLGDDDALSRYPNVKVSLGFGCTKVGPERELIVRSLRLPPERWAAVIHPHAYVSASAKVSPGAIVLAGAVVNPCSTIGEHSIINIGAMIDHDVTIGRFVHVCPGTAIGGGVTISDHAFVGIGAALRDHISVHRETMIGMGAAVTKSFTDTVTLTGVPAAPRLERRNLPMTTAKR